MYYAAFITTQPEENHLDEMCYSNFSTLLDSGTGGGASAQTGMSLPPVPCMDPTGTTAGPGGTRTCGGANVQTSMSLLPVQQQFITEAHGIFQA